MLECTVLWYRSGSIIHDRCKLGKHALCLERCLCSSPSAIISQIIFILTLFFSGVWSFFSFLLQKIKIYNVQYAILTITVSNNHKHTPKKLHQLTNVVRGLKELSYWYSMTRWVWRIDRQPPIILIFILGVHVEWYYLQSVYKTYIMKVSIRYYKLVMRTTYSYY